MHSINVLPLTKDNFARYGTYVDLLNPKSPFFTPGTPQFYSDLAFVDSSEKTMSYSIALE